MTLTPWLLAGCDGGLSPKGWGQSPKGKLVYRRRKPLLSDWGRLHAVIQGLVTTGYAEALGTRRRKLADIMRAYDLGYAEANRCLRIAQRRPINGGKHWTRLGGWL